MTPPQSLFMNVAGQPLHYLKSGTGKRLLVAFHGYGNHAGLFNELGNYLSEEFTTLSFDLPYHGKSECPSNFLVKKEHLKELIVQLRDIHKVDKIALAGYSIGGRVCLCITEVVPEYIEQVMLVASDGLVFNNFYCFVTRNFLGKRLFKGFTESPGIYLKILSLLRDRKIIDSSKYKFMTYYIKNHADRTFLLNVWNCLQELVPDRNKLKEGIRQYRIPVHLFMGHHDKVIPVKHAQAFSHDLDTAVVVIVEKGHQVIDKDTLPEMAQYLIHTAC